MEKNNPDRFRPARWIIGGALLTTAATVAALSIVGVEGKSSLALILALVPALAAGVAIGRLAAGPRILLNDLGNRLARLEADLNLALSDAAKARETARDQGALIQALPDILYRLDPQGRITYLSPSARRYGIHPADLIGRVFLDFVHPDDRERTVNVILERRTRLRRASGFEVRLVLPEKTPPPFERFFWVSAQGRYEEDPPSAQTFLGTQGVARDITEMKNAQRELEHREEWFRALFEHSPDGIIVADGQTRRFLWTNPSVQRMFEYTSEEFTQLDVSHIHPPESLESIQAAFTAMAQGQSPMAMNVPCQTKSGRLFFADIHGGPVVLSGVECNLGFFRDARDRLEAERALRESEEKFQIFTNEVSFEGLAMHDGGRILEINKRFAQMHQAEPDRLLGRSLFELVAPASRDRVRMMLRIRSEEPYEIDGLRLDGATFPAEIRAKNMMYRGRMVRAMAIRDISAPKAVEQVLKDAEERYRALFELAGDAIFIIGLEGDETGRIIDANEAAARMHGYNREEMRTMRITDLDTLESAALASGRIERLRAGEWLQAELEHRRADGSTFPVEVSAGAITLNGRRCILAFDRDITDRKSREAERRRFEDQLRHSQKMEAVGTLTSGIAHDFNNLLQILAGYIQLLGSSADLDAQPLEWLDHMRRAADRGSDLVRRMLTFSRRLEPERRPLRLNDHVLQTVEFLARALPKTIDLQTDLAEDLPPVPGDPGQLEQVFLNLGKNAADAMPGGGTLTFATGRTHLGQDRLEAWPNVSPGPFARVSVIDTGQGMDSATLGRMFDPFFTTKAPGKGTGLGLAMVYGIVQGHGGVIECQSRPGRGTRFDLYWPITPMIPTDASKTGDGDAKSAGGSETILVVDDEPDLVALTRAFLTSVGYNVLTAASGEEAMEIMAARGREVDLVILDMGLPGMGGPACLERLRETRPELRVLIASGYVDGIQSMGQPLRDLQTAFIGKPFRFEALLHRLRELLDSAGSPTAKPTGEE